MSAYLIDTHVAAWVYKEDFNRFSRKVLRRIDESLLFLSPVSLWEFDNMYAIQRLNKPALDVAENLSEQRDIYLEESTSYRAIVERGLDIGWTRDPFDRLIVAHAMVAGLPLITADQKILEHYEDALW